MTAHFGQLITVDFCAVAETQRYIEMVGHVQTVTGVHPERDIGGRYPSLGDINENRLSILFCGELYIMQCQNRGAFCRLQVKVQVP